LHSWSRERRVIGKSEATGGEANPRFVVTSLKRSEAGARQLYEKTYCAHGDSTSTATMHANQLGLWSASMAYVSRPEMHNPAAVIALAGHRRQHRVTP